MFRFTIALLRYFAYFLVGLFLAFPIASMFGAISLFFSWLPFIWEFLWRSGLSLMLLTALSLFIEGLNDGTKNNF